MAEISGLERKMLIDEQRGLGITLERKTGVNGAWYVLRQGGQVVELTPDLMRELTMAYNMDLMTEIGLSHSGDPTRRG